MLRMEGIDGAWFAYYVRATVISRVFTSIYIHHQDEPVKEILVSQKHKPSFF